MRGIIRGTRAELALIEEVLAEPERHWMFRLMAFLETPRVKLQLTPVRIAWLAHVVMGTDPPQLVVSQEWPLYPDWFRQRVLTHEAVHLKGYPHNEAAGYVTHIQRDTLSPKLIADIERGNVHRFDPRRYGLDPNDRLLPPNEQRVDTDRDLRRFRMRK